MSAVHLLQKLVLSGWKFHLDGEQLRYRAPRQAVSDLELSQLKANKAEIIRLLQESPLCVELAPLSYNQRALWFLWALAPQSTAYNQSYSMHTASRTSAETWRESCACLVARHAMLRTVFRRGDEEPYQQVCAPDAMVWQEHDLSQSSVAEQEVFLAAAHNVPFDLEKDLPARFHLCRLPQGRLQLLITMHHIVCDGWSIEIIRHELEGFYDALTEGKRAELPALAHNYRDYVWWQRGLLQGAQGEALWAYWRERLAGPLPVIQMPTDRPRPSVQTYDGDAVEVSLPDDLASALRKLCSEAGVTLNVALLTAYFVLLFRFTGQSDLLVGTPTAGRSRLEDANTVGYFVDPVVIRARVDAGETLAGLLSQIGKVVVDAIAHRDFPFALLVERLRVERDPGRSPIFDTTFNFLSRRESEIEDETGPKFRQADGKFDLSFTVLEDGSRLHASLGYNSALFEKPTIQRLADCWRAILEGMIADRSTTCQCVSLWSGRSSKLFPTLSGRPLQGFDLAHRLFEQCVRATPDAPAVHADGVSLTYREVNERANALAHRLLAEGIQRDSQVAVSTGRTPAFLIAILAVLKAGGSYVPIDPSYPRELRNYFVEQAKAALILTEEPLLETWAGCGVPLVPADRAEVGVASNPDVEMSADQLAYVVYTSGSTGRPKGVAIEHRSLSNYIGGMIEDLDIKPGSSFAFLSTIGADLGNTAIFLSIANGGCLHIVPEDLRIDSDGFRRYMSNHSIDYLKIVPSHFAALTAGGNLADAMPAKGLILGGEGADPKWVSRLQIASPSCNIFNHYGPTETTVGVLTYRFDSDAVPETRFLPLQMVAPGSAIYLLDRNGESVPPGFAGELAIGGECLARGYIHAETLTSERFVEHGEVGVLYSTGDTARMLASGKLELLGRNDRQVSLRGFRVELGQVEAALLREAKLQQCHVLPVKHHGEISHLAAYVVCDDSGDRLTSSDLREIAERSLPPYMVPERYVLLDRLPVTVNGKIDAGRLLEDSHAEESHQSHAGARDHFEFRLAGMMAEVLGVVKVGVRDDFFRLGGHSLLCVRLAGMIYDEFGVRLPLPSFFSCRTVEQLATRVRGHDGASSSVLVPIRHAGKEAPLFLFPGAGGSSVYFYPLVQHMQADRPVWGVQYLGLNPGADDSLPQTVEEMASHAVTAMRREQGDGPYYLAGHSLGGLVAFEAARRLHAMGCETVFVAVIDNAAPGENQEDRGSWGQARWLRHIALRLEKLYRVSLGVSEELTVDTLLERMLSAGLLPPGTSKGYLRSFIDVYCTNAIAAARYKPERYESPFEITLLRAMEEDVELGQEHMGSDESLGWGRFSSQPIDVIDVPGTHITMLAEPHVAALASAFESRLSKALRVPLQAGI